MEHIRTFEPRASDFYDYATLLTDREQAVLAKLRAYLETEVKPIAGEYWDRAESLMQVIKPLADLGIFAFAWEETRPFANSAVSRGFVALEMARVDPSGATLAGAQNGLVADTLSLCASRQQRDEWLPKLARTARSAHSG